MTRRFFRFKGCPQTGLPYPGARGPFLETQVICRARNQVFTVKAWVLASKLLHFVSLTDSFILLDANLLKPFSCMQTTKIFTGPLIIGTSEARSHFNTTVAKQVFPFSMEVYENGTFSVKNGI